MRFVLTVHMVVFKEYNNEERREVEWRVESQACCILKGFLSSAALSETVLAAIGASSPQRLDRYFEMVSFVQYLLSLDRL